MMREDIEKHQVAGDRDGGEHQHCCPPPSRQFVSMMSSSASTSSMTSTSSTASFCSLSGSVTTPESDHLPNGPYPHKTTASSHDCGNDDSHNDINHPPVMVEHTYDDDGGRDRSNEQTGLFESDATIEVDFPDSVDASGAAAAKTAAVVASVVASPASSSPPVWRLVRDMFVLHVVVWLTVTGCTQYSSKLALPTTPAGHPRTVDEGGTILVGRNGTAGQQQYHHHCNNINNTATAWTAMDVTRQHHPSGGAEDDDCVYVPGGGFSGFWFSLGRLQSLRRKQQQRQSLRHPQDHLEELRPQQPPTHHHHKDRFVCYSAGCLGVVATLLDRHSMSELYAIARAIQVEWAEGRLHRYQVVEAFVDALLDGVGEGDEDGHDVWKAIRDQLFIVTTVPTPAGLWEARMRQPHDAASLKTMLLQTTWIPLAVGSSFTHLGHLDGAFSTLQHPSCRRRVGLAGPFDVSKDGTGVLSDMWMLWSNTLNVNLAKEDVENLWQMGLDHGV
jgi:hypothetical protein